MRDSTKLSILSLIAMITFTLLTSKNVWYIYNALFWSIVTYWVWMTDYY